VCREGEGSSGGGGIGEGGGGGICDSSQYNSIQHVGEKKKTTVGGHKDEDKNSGHGQGKMQVIVMGEIFFLLGELERLATDRMYYQALRSMCGDDRCGDDRCYPVNMTEAEAKAANQIESQSDPQSESREGVGAGAVELLQLLLQQISHKDSDISLLLTLPSLQDWAVNLGVVGTPGEEGKDREESREEVLSGGEKNGNMDTIDDDGILYENMQNMHAHSKSQKSQKSSVEPMQNNNNSHTVEGKEEHVRVDRPQSQSTSQCLPQLDYPHSPQCVLREYVFNRLNGMLKLKL
jgi:hypothetical protein